MELFVVDVPEMTPDGVVIHGITNKGAILLGDRFTRLAKKTGAETWAPPIPVDLRVRRIVAYRHELPELSLGMGGGLLVGVCSAEIGKGDILSGESSNEEPGSTELTA